MTPTPGRAQKPRRDTLFLGGQIGPGPRARQIAQQAANEAGRSFDRRYPLVPLEEWEP
jgi:hypothetical protein